MSILHILGFELISLMHVSHAIQCRLQPDSDAIPCYGLYWESKFASLEYLGLIWMIAVVI